MPLKNGSKLFIARILPFENVCQLPQKRGNWLKFESYAFQTYGFLEIKAVCRKDTFSCVFSVLCLSIN